jgi:cell division protein FtsB
MQHELRMKQLRSEIEQLRKESEQIERETEQLRSENARLAEPVTFRKDVAGWRHSGRLPKE